MDKGYSQEYLADVIGVSQKTYSNMENDKSNISFETIKQLIEFYDIDISELDVKKFISEGKFKDSIENQKTNEEANGNPMSEKLILQMEERIEELKIRNADLKSRLNKYE